MYLIENICLFLFTLLIPFAVGFPIQRHVIEECDLSRLDDLYKKLDTIIETLNGKSTKIGICTKAHKYLRIAESCADLRLAGATCDGTYVIYPFSLGPVTVNCDMTTDGGGWTVVLRRGNYGNKKTSFVRNWDEYKNGFGDSEGEFWLGNKVLHRMTMFGEDMELRILTIDRMYNTVKTKSFEFFNVENETLFYGLNCYDNIMSKGVYNTPFKTYDVTDKSSDQYFRGWWYNSTTEFYEVLTLPPSNYLKIKMMFRPQNFTLGNNLRNFISD